MLLCCFRVAKQAGRQLFRSGASSRLYSYSLLIPKHGGSTRQHASPFWHESPLNPEGPTVLPHDVLSNVRHKPFFRSNILQRPTASGWRSSLVGWRPSLLAPPTATQRTWVVSPPCLRWRSSCCSGGGSREYRFRFLGELSPLV